MQSPFKRRGFDTLISKGTKISGDLVLDLGSTTIVDGEVNGKTISVSEPNNLGKTELVINGKVAVVNDVNVTAVTITGELHCEKLIVEGQLSVKAGAKVVAKELRYRHIHIESGAIVLAQMNHLDHISAGEQT